MAKKRAVYKSYIITVNDNNSITINRVRRNSKTGEVTEGKKLDNSIGALRKIAKSCKFKYDNSWNTQNFGSKLVDYINSNNFEPKGGSSSKGGCLKTVGLVFVGALVVAALIAGLGFYFADKI